MQDQNLTTESFELFLTWLDPNREEAGLKYEAMRRRLLVFFEMRGCLHADDLTDETINIVIRKIPSLDGKYHGDAAAYFYAVAHNQLRKYFSERARHAGGAPNEQTAASDGDEPRRKEVEDRCLRRCLARLAPDERRLALAYYQMEKRAKIEHHKQLAVEFGCTESALRTRMSRLRQTLRACLFSCQEREEQL
jgi:RNA polymerase sigma factor (sigma-70 family)